MACEGQRNKKHSGYNLLSEGNVEESYLAVTVMGMFGRILLNVRQHAEAELALAAAL